MNGRLRTAALALAAAVLAASALPTLARASDTQWDAQSSAAGCSVFFKLKPERAVQWRQAAGVIWRTNGVFAFALFDDELDGLDSVPLEIASATGSRFSGDAILVRDKDQAKSDPRGVYVLEVAGRKDLEKALVGDLTFTYRERSGRKAKITAPFGMAVPRLDACNSTAAALAAAQSEDEGSGEAEQPAGGSASGGAKNRDPDIIGNGSGVAVDAIGHVVTDAHVVSPCRRLTSPGLGQAEVVAVDKASDLAILRFPKPPPAFVLFRSGPLRLGERVVAAGFPLNDLLQNGLNVTVGNLSALSGFEGDRRFIQFSAPTTFGNSGGPVVDQSGRLLGLVESGVNAKLGQNINFAVAAPTIEAFLDENQVSWRTGKDGPQSAERIALQARGHTVLLECRK